MVTTYMTQLVKSVKSKLASYLSKVRSKLDSLVVWLKGKAAANSGKLLCWLGFHKSIEKNYFTAEVKDSQVKIVEVESLICSRCKNETVKKMQVHEIPLPKTNLVTELVVNKR